ncbi:hypothetical protein F2P56_010588 [Juglans regia]|uniref:Non-canonical poly(A) RNA polymerase protein Trf4-1-like n=2 Tax=Juglans regia TaxID=51240 RepID=A0A833XQS4_JUGRE|nr:uncharacterized protein LOC108990618 isoform X2 [Juglans regia]KAF5470038.1 hypothetical protein F2P56_010588 [Juglans regia]
MSKPNLNFPSKTSLSNPFMSQNQLIDSLTSHISLYSSHSSFHSPNPNPNPIRSSILKWFSSLTVHQRQAHLTAVDSNFVRLLFQMLRKVRTHGRGSFIILPDLPSHDLPGLCFKKSRGLLSRVADSNESERLLFDSTRFFASSEGENINECSCSIKNVDTVTVSEELVENLDRFVNTMDEISNRGFLRGDETELGSDWVELEWLKAKGYYTMEAFVANRLEVALRLAWLNCNNGRKRGVKLKEKASAAGVAANVFWRKKGCVDWWVNLDTVTRRKILTVALGKSAKALTHEILKGATSGLEDEMWLLSAGVEHPERYNHAVTMQKTIPSVTAEAELGSIVTPATLLGKHTSLANAFNSILVLQDIIMIIFSCHSSVYDKGKVFFSTLGSVCTISDCIFRKLRGFLMVVSLDCTKLELLGEEIKKSSPNKSNEKLGAVSRRKKARTRNMKKDVNCAIAHEQKVDLMEPKKIHYIPQEKESCREMSTVLEHARGMVVEKAQTSSRKSKKEKNKNKKPGFNNLVQVRNLERSVQEDSSHSVVSQGEAAKSGRASDNSTAQNEIVDNPIGNNTLASDSSLRCGFANGPTKEDDAMESIQGASDISTSQNATADNTTGSNILPSNSSLPSSSANGHNGVDNPVQSIRGGFINGSSDSLCCINPECYNLPNNRLANQSISSRIETLICNTEPPTMPALEVDTVLNNGDIDSQNCANRCETNVKLTFPDKPIRPFDVKEESFRVRDSGSVNTYDTGPSNSSERPSNEWPIVAPFYFPSFNSHLPAATDRLHLDVGRNWHNHFQQSFIPTMHHARNSPIEGGCNPVLSRPLPMSLDWPPVVRSACGLAPSVTCNYESGFIPRLQSTYPQGFTPHNLRLNAMSIDDERKYSGDVTDLVTNTQELADECDSHCISEEDVEVHAVSGMDYNQYFGGGVMYWNPSDLPGTGFSRPPSLSSDDSSWAWREADMIRAVDDMVAYSSSYSTNGLTSPTAASFGSPFDPLGPGALGYVMPGSEVPGKMLHPSSALADTTAEEEPTGSLSNLPIDVEGKTGDSLPYPILRPIIIPHMSRERSRSEFKRNPDHKSPCVPPARREQPRIKRPPSPVVLCVPRAPRPPPPSPVSDSRKQRGFPTVRSGSSSPRHWGVRGWYHDGNNLDDACLRMDGAEVVWPTWRNNNLAAHPMIQPLPATLLQDRLIAISQLARDQEHPDIAFPLQPPELQSCPTQRASLSLMHSLLHDEIDSFCKQVAAANMARKPYINWAIKRVTRSLQVLWPRSRTNVFGSNATGLSLPTSDVDLVVCLPPVRNLEPIKEAGILEGRNGIKETCLQHAARYLANQEWVKNDSLKAVENTAIPIIMLAVEVPHDLVTSSTSNAQSPKETTHVTGEQGNDAHSDAVVFEDSAPSSTRCIQTDHVTNNDSKSVRLDISFRSPSHTGLQTTELVKELTDQFPAATPLALVLKQFLADRSLDQSYSGGLSSYCLVLLIIRFLQHEHHLGRPINHKFGSLLMDFLYFFGNVFDPRQMRISVQGSGVYMKRERGCSIDPIHIDDPLFPTNNVGRNCFRIHQCIKAFSEAYSVLENELTCIPDYGDACSMPPCRLLPKIIPSIDLV